MEIIKLLAGQKTCLRDTGLLSVVCECRYTDGSRCSLTADCPLIGVYCR